MSLHDNGVSVLHKANLIRW